MRVPGSSVRIQRRTRSRVPRVLPRRPRASKSALRRSIERPAAARRVRRSDACAPLPCDGRARGDHPAKPCGPGSHALASARASWAGTSSSSCVIVLVQRRFGPKHTNGWHPRQPRARPLEGPVRSSADSTDGPHGRQTSARIRRSRVPKRRKIAAVTDCLRRNQTATLPRPHAAGRPIDRAPAASEAIGSTTKRPLVAVWEKAH